MGLLLHRIRRRLSRYKWAQRIGIRAEEAEQPAAQATPKPSTSKPPPKTKPLPKLSPWVKDASKVQRKPTATEKRFAEALGATGREFRGTAPIPDKLRIAWHIGEQLREVRQYKHFSTAFDDGVFECTTLRKVLKAKGIGEKETLNAYRKAERIMLSEETVRTRIMNYVNTELEKIVNQDWPEKDKVKAFGRVMARAAAEVLKKIELGGK